MQCVALLRLIAMSVPDTVEFVFPGAIVRLTRDVATRLHGVIAADTLFKVELVDTGDRHVLFSINDDVALSGVHRSIIDPI